MYSLSNLWKIQIYLKDVSCKIHNSWGATDESESVKNTCLLRINRLLWCLLASVESISSNDIYSYKLWNFSMEYYFCGVHYRNTKCEDRKKRFQPSHSSSLEYFPFRIVLFNISSSVIGSLIYGFSLKSYCKLVRICISTLCLFFNNQLLPK